VVVFNKADLNPAVNIGEKTAPETFVFAGNIWYCMDDPSASRPALPARETDGQYGRDPKLKDPAKGDLTITDVDIAKTLPGLAAADPTRNAEARALLEEGLKLYEQGRVIGIPLAFSKEKMKSALEKFETLSQTCPESDSAADAYFYAAEIIKDCLRSDARDDAKSTDYYQRAYQVDPNLSHPAHFQRAVVLDYRLHNRDEALVEYRNVLKFEANKPFFWSKTNADYAAHRIKELGGPGE
jgi:tetratricopeptide (TPR) repeat protein